MFKKVKLNQTSIPKNYYKNTSSKIVGFLEFVDKFHPNMILNKENLTKLFDYQIRLYILIKIILMV